MSQKSEWRHHVGAEVSGESDECSFTLKLKRPDGYPRKVDEKINALRELSLEVSIRLHEIAMLDMKAVTYKKPEQSPT
jgi:hypothetical protein